MAGTLMGVTMAIVPTQGTVSCLLDSPGTVTVQRGRSAFRSVSSPLPCQLRMTVLEHFVSNQWVYGRLRSGRLPTSLSLAKALAHSESLCSEMTLVSTVVCC